MCYWYGKRLFGCGHIIGHYELPPKKQKDKGPCQKLLDLIQQDENADPAPCKGQDSLSLVDETYDAEAEEMCPSCVQNWKRDLDAAWQNVYDQFRRSCKESELVNLMQQRERLFQSEDLDKAYYDKIETAQNGFIKKFQMYLKARGSGSKKHSSEPSTSLDDIGEGEEEE